MSWIGWLTDSITRATASCRWFWASVASVSLSMKCAPTRPPSNSPSPCTTSPRRFVCSERSGAARAPPSMVVEDIRALLAIVPSLTRHLARLHDLVVGYVYFAVFAPLSAIRVVDVVQTWLLFHNALSEGVVVDDILKQARQSQETSSIKRPERGDRPTPTPGRAPAAGARGFVGGQRGRVGVLPGRGVAAAAAVGLGQRRRRRPAAVRAGVPLAAGGRGRLLVQLAGGDAAAGRDVGPGAGERRAGLRRPSRPPPHRLARARGMS